MGAVSCLHRSPMTGSEAAISALALPAGGRVGAGDGWGPWSCLARSKNRSVQVSVVCGLGAGPVGPKRVEGAGRAARRWQRSAL